MRQLNKIQCPSCGATSSFSELKEAHYQCGYCLSQWEQASILPNPATLDEQFYKTAIAVYEEQKKFTNDRPKYFERAYAAIIQLDAYAKLLTDTAFRKDLFKKIRELIDVQKRAYSDMGVSENANYFLLLINNSELMIYLFYLADLEHIHAKSIYLSAETEDDLVKALGHLNIAEKIRENSIDDFEESLAVSKVGVLQRMGDTSMVYEYLHQLRNRFSEAWFRKTYFERYQEAPSLDDIESHMEDIAEYREEVTLLFEPIFFSAEYLDWEGKQNINKES